MNYQKCRLENYRKELWLQIFSSIGSPAHQLDIWQLLWDGKIMSSKLSHSNAEISAAFRNNGPYLR